MLNELCSFFPGSYQFVSALDQISETLLSAHLLRMIIKSQGRLLLGLVPLIGRVKDLIPPPITDLALEGPVKAQYPSGLRERVRT